MTLRFVSYPNDPPVLKEVRGGPWPIKEYFDLHVRCGEVNNDLPEPDGPLRRLWIETQAAGCGAADWDVKPTLWYPRPGRQFELTCRKCGRVSGVEVREPIEEPKP
jgi:hypothetical protein